MYMSWAHKQDVLGEIVLCFVVRQPPSRKPHSHNYGKLFHCLAGRAYKT